MEFRSSLEWMEWASGVWNRQSGIAGSGMGWTEWNGMDRVEWDGQSGMGWMDGMGWTESRMGMGGWENIGNIGNGLCRNMVYDNVRCWGL